MTETDRATLLALKDVSKIYDDGKVRALDHVSLEIFRGEYVAIIGPSGSGKSTLLNLLGALDAPTEGEVWFEGKPLAAWGNLDRFRAHQLGFVFQSFHLMPVLTAIRNVQVPMFETRRTGQQKIARARELLELVGMSHRADHRPNQLSVGERQRVAIARALANEPQLLLADEPTGNLDSSTAEEIFALFDRLHQDGMTIVLITHDPLLSQRAQRVIAMKDGRIV